MMLVLIFNDCKYPFSIRLFSEMFQKAQQHTISTIKTYSVIAIKEVLAKPKQKTKNKRTA